MPHTPLTHHSAAKAHGHAAASANQNHVCKLGTSHGVMLILAHRSNVSSNEDWPDQTTLACPRGGGHMADGDRALGAGACAELAAAPGGCSWSLCTWCEISPKPRIIPLLLCLIRRRGTRRRGCCASRHSQDGRRRRRGVVADAPNVLWGARRVWRRRRVWRLVWRRRHIWRLVYGRERLGR